MESAWLRYGARRLDRRVGRFRRYCRFRLGAGFDRDGRHVRRTPGGRPRHQHVAAQSLRLMLALGGGGREHALVPDDAAIPPGTIRRVASGDRRRAPSARTTSSLASREYGLIIGLMTGRPLPALLGHMALRGHGAPRTGDNAELASRCSHDDKPHKFAATIITIALATE